MLIYLLFSLLALELFIVSFREENKLPLTEFGADIVIGMVVLACIWPISFTILLFMIVKNLCNGLKLLAQPIGKDNDSR